MDHRSSGLIDQGANDGLGEELHDVEFIIMDESGKITGGQILHSISKLFKSQVSTLKVEKFKFQH